MLGSGPACSCSPRYSFQVIAQVFRIETSESPHETCPQFCATCQISALALCVLTPTEN